jgi:hypothetical protein
LASLGLRQLGLGTTAGGIGGLLVADLLQLRSSPSNSCISSLCLSRSFLRLDHAFLKIRRTGVRGLDGLFLGLHAALLGGQGGFEILDAGLRGRQLGGDLPAWWPDRPPDVSICWEASFARRSETSRCVAKRCSVSASLAATASAFFLASAARAAAFDCSALSVASASER